MKKLRKVIGSLLLASALISGAAFAANIASVDVVQTFSAEDIDPRWSYIFQVSNGLGINQYEVAVTASTLA